MNVLRMFMAGFSLLFVTACAHKGTLPSAEVPKVVYIDQKEVDNGFPNVRASFSTRAPFRGKTHFILTIPPQGDAQDEYALCYISTYATHSGMLSQVTGGGVMQALEDGLQRAVDRLIQGVAVGDLGLPLAGAAAAGALGGAHAAWNEELRLFDNDVRGCTMRRVPGAYVFMATGQSPD